jgi:transcriptional regulator with XRE-family HTH domain
MEFSKNVNFLIEDEQISTRKMLLDNDLGYNLMNDWEKKGKIPGAEKVTKLADYFNVSSDFLLGRTKLSERSKKVLSFVFDKIG